MNRDIRHVLMRCSEGESFRFTFADGTGLAGRVVRDTHVDLDDTVWVIRVDAEPGECGWQLYIHDIRTISTMDGNLLYPLD